MIIDDHIVVSMCVCWLLLHNCISKNIHHMTWHMTWHMTHDGIHAHIHTTRWTNIRFMHSKSIAHQYVEILANKIQSTLQLPHESNTSGTSVASVAYQSIPRRPNQTLSRGILLSGLYASWRKWLVHMAKHAYTAMICHTEASLAIIKLMFTIFNHQLTLTGYAMTTKHTNRKIIHHTLNHRQYWASISPKLFTSPGMAYSSPIISYSSQLLLAINPLLLAINPLWLAINPSY